MRKIKRTLPVVLPALAILGMLAVPGYAGKPTPSPQPHVVVTWKSACKRAPPRE